MSFDDLFRKDRPNKMLQITPSRLVATFTRTSGGWHGLVGGRHRDLGALVLLLAPPAGHAGERLTAHRRLFRS
jgi:hypothetical protein